MNKERILEEYQDIEDLIFLQGFDDAIVGTAFSHGSITVCYSIKSMVNILMTRDGMTESEALEWLDHNTIFAYFGSHTPVYIDDIGK